MTSTPPIRVLIVDNSKMDRAAYRRLLDKHPDGQYAFVEAATAEEGLRRVGSELPDCILLDYKLPDFDGLEFLARLPDAAAGRMIPVVVLTGDANESVAADVLKRGAQDCLVKTNLSEHTLITAVARAIARASLQAQVKRANQSLETQNRRLTELYETAYQFVDNVAREFRTPLAVIKEFASIIGDGLAGPIADEQQEYLSIIRSRVDDLETMVNDMLDISKLESGQLGFYRRPCSLTDILDNVRTSLERKANTAKVRLEVAIDSDLPLTYGDPDKIGRVIVNLVANAMRFSSEGQSVSIWAEPDADGSQVRVGVTDEGPGIGHENLKKLFQQFRQQGTTVRAGTRGFGLGLDIAHALVRLNFGEMNVLSELGKGSTFSFTVPVAEVGKLLPRYLHHVQEYRGDNAFVSIVDVSAQGSGEGAALDDVEPFLQHQIRRTDLIFPAGGRRWLLVVPTYTKDLGSLLHRILKAREEANRNRPSGQLPLLTLNVDGTWRVDEDLEDFLSVFHDALSAGSPGPQATPAECVGS